MPSRRSVKSPPKFCFVTLEYEANPVSRLKINSQVAKGRAARSHAAYWGGPVKHERQSKKRIAEHQDNTTPSDSDAYSDLSSRDDAKPVSGGLARPAIRRRRPAEPKTAKAFTVPPKIGSPRHIEPDHLQHLPLVLPEIAVTGSLFTAALPTFQFFGAAFVKKFVLSDHDDYSIMFSGCLLLSYAHSMALTGYGTKTILLELKSQVIRQVSAKMKSSNGILSPQCLTAILALGSPIVCLVSQDLPMGLSIWDYINASMQGDHLCCPESADTAQRALDERIIHRQATRRLFSKSNASIHDAESLDLLRYVSNCMNVSMAIEAANHPSTSLADVEELFPETNLCANCVIPAHWTSPLTCQWFDETSTIRVERQMLLLAGFVHKWLATFFDGDNPRIELMKDLLEERADLRQRIESFVRMTRTSNLEAEAMYESCRWAASVLLTVEKRGVPVHVAAKHVRIQPRLMRRLRMTDLSNLWGSRRGLLFWVAAVCHFATAGQCFPLLCTALFARFTQEVVMLDCCSEIAIKPLRRLKQFETLCCRAELTSQIVATHF